jgi:D-alanyl-lipoteichoic acid acyltransferase DltB (MBOAT superfamily)
MLFNSLHFLLFLPVVVGLYYLLPKQFRWILIFVASCYFYMAFVPKYILILFLIIIIDYVSGILIERARKKNIKRLFLVVSILSNVGLLAFFKYFNFINENIGVLSEWMGLHFKPSALDVILPIGLSFHTFQSMSYTIEVYRGNQKAEKHLGYFANYVLFFPQMVAGPIEKYSHLGNELRQPVDPVYENFARGFRLILFGLFVKMAVADNLAPIVNDVYADPSAFNSIDIFGAIVFFSFQIYADFYGYSTIALGAAKLLGIDLIDNFKTPYLSLSINDFWRRWHISLTSWFREYIFIPLGGSRVNTFHWTLNILIIFFVSGLWHGANWTFVVWGLLHGIIYLLERAFNKIFNFKIKEGFSFLNLLLGIKTFLIVSFIWIFFRAENFDKAMNIFRSLLGNWHITGREITYGYSFFFIVILILSDVLFSRRRADQWLEEKSVYLRWATYSILIFFVMAMSGMENLPFIYFQF